LHASLGPVAAASIGLVVLDATDRAGLQALAARTRVVVSAAGPFTDLGAPLLRACAESGVHYADLSGEPLWQRAMVDRYDTQARQTGAKIVLAAGYDSAPFGAATLPFSGCTSHSDFSISTVFHHIFIFCCFFFFDSILLLFPRLLAD
jgi:short subunit dehydrogenase-like uncharacterized protein